VKRAAEIVSRGEVTQRFEKFISSDDPTSSFALFFSKFINPHHDTAESRTAYQEVLGRILFCVALSRR
jgi:hypothetical protein